MPAAAFASPNLVLNGDFSQTGGVTQNTEFGFSAPAGNFLPDWSTTTGSNPYNILWFSGTQSTTNAAGQYSNGVTGNEKLDAATPNPPSGNTHFVSLDGDSNVRGALTQSISGLVIGNLYQVAFNWGASQIQSRNGATTEYLSVDLGTSAPTGITPIAGAQATPTLNNPSQGFTGWYAASFDFLATSTTETLSFLSVGTPNGAPPVAVLDNVTLEQVPEPAAVGVLAVGLAALTFFRLRGRKSL